MLSTNSNPQLLNSELAVRSRTRRRAIDGAWAIFWYIILSLIALCLALPLVWLVSTSLKTGAQTFVMPPIWIPDPFVWENYPEAFRAVPFGKYFWNTAQIVVFATMGTLFTASMAAFAFAVCVFPIESRYFCSSSRRSCYPAL